jgi:hypothetical protein
MPKFQFQLPIYVAGQVYVSGDSGQIEISTPLEVSNGGCEVIPVFRRPELATEFMRRAEITGFDVVEFFQPVRLLVMLIRAKRAGSKMLAVDPVVGTDDMGIGISIDRLIPLLKQLVASQENPGERAE